MTATPTTQRDPDRPDAAARGGHAATPAEREVGVVIVNWNAGTDLAECVANLRAGIGGRSTEIVVIDNGSTDDSLAPLAGAEDVRVITAGRNLGFAAGANLGARHGTTPLILFLNPDAVLLPNAIDAAVAFLEAHPDVGIVGPLLVDGDGRWQPSAGHLGIVSHLLLDTRFVRRPPRHPQYVDWIHGAFLLMRRVLFERLGGFDERFFMYAEDMDLCARARVAGFRTAIVPAARAVHYGNRSGAQRFGDDRDAEVLKAELRFFAASGRKRDIILFRALGIGKFATKALLQLLRGDRDAASRTWRMVKACATTSVTRDEPAAST